MVEAVSEGVTHDHEEPEQGTIAAALGRFTPFDRLSPEDRVLLSIRSSLESVPAGKRLFEVGDEDPWIFCLLEGSLRLAAGDGRIHRVDAGTQPASRPVAQLKPRRYAAVAETPARLIRIDATGFGELGAGVEMQDYLVSEVEEDAFTDPPDPHYQRLTEGQYALPTLPEVATQTCRLMRDEDVSLRTLAKVITRDPTIAAKLVKAANSPLYYGKEAIESCERAVHRLGLNTTRQLVLAFSLGELFRAKSEVLRARMRSLWEHSTEVGAICLMLARSLGNFDPDEAQLAGLLHDIGLVPILRYAQEQPDLSTDIRTLDALSPLAREIGERMLRGWGFPAPLVSVVSEAESWWRDTSPEPELVDLVIVGQLLSFIGKSRPPDVPNFSRLPAFRKVAGDALDPPKVLALLDEAAEEIREARALLGG